MVSKPEMMIKSSTDHDEAVEETLIIDGEEANVRREKVKMEKVREENERLKLTLSQMMKNYQSLQMQINGITEEHQSKKPTNPDSMNDDSELVCLSLGRSSKREEIKKNSSNNSNSNSSEETRNLDGTELGLNWKLDLEKNSAEDSRNLKPTNESSLDECLSKEEGSKKNSRNEDEDILQQNPVKKPRVSVRAVINTQTMQDGCQWRKYGQKIAKGNPCPRAYYRCTVTSSCPVRKQVQRCIEDMSILVTTYEGSHNHPLPAAAATMASATSAAAAMLSCGSTTTSPPPNNPNFFFPSSNPINSNTLARATISTSQSHPTVILDLTPPKPTTKFSSTFNFSSSFDPTKTGSWETRFPTINSLAPSSTPLFSTIQTQPANDHKVSAAAITQDPTFQSALAAAISSFVAKNNGMNFHLMNFSQPSSTSNNASVGCGTTFINRYPKPQQKSFKHFAPFTLSGSKSQVLSLADEGEQIKL